MPPRKAKIVEDDDEQDHYSPVGESDQEDVYTEREGAASESDEAYGESDASEDEKPKGKQPAKKAKAAPAAKAPRKKVQKVSVETVPAQFTTGKPKSQSTSSAPRKNPSMGGGVVIPSIFQQSSAPRRVGMSRNARVAPLHPYASS
jgi:hypothetical protein